MDPTTTLIMTALTFGATEIVKGALGEAARDAYTGLKELVKNHFAGNEKAERALADHEADPETYDKPLAKALTETKADQDAQILEQAKTLMAVADPAGTAAGKYHVTVSGGKGVQVGDGNTQTVN